MLIKWIKCQVPVPHKLSFSKAQETWTAVKGTEGFLGQIGGWDIHGPTEAGILSF